MKYDGTLGNQDGSVISNKTKFLVPQEIVSAFCPFTGRGSWKHFWRCYPVGCSFPYMGVGGELSWKLSPCLAYLYLIKSKPVGLDLLTGLLCSV